VDGHGHWAREGLARDAVALFFMMLELDGRGGSVDAKVTAAGFASYDFSYCLTSHGGSGAADAGSLVLGRSEAVLEGPCGCRLF
jgi:hypothetical protein